ncbi:MAG: DUF3857 domain-containing protein [Bacteroidota bacterium]
MKATLFLCAFCVFTITVDAQEHIKKFGSVSAYEFETKHNSADTTYGAVVLFDHGKVEFQQDLTGAMERHVRILILNESGYDFGTVLIGYNKEREQDVMGIKGMVYTLDGDKVSKRKLKGDDIFVEEVRDGIELTKFTLPNLEPGVIIEYRYKRIFGSPFFMPDWEFHKSVPVQWSEYEMFIPGSLQYKMVFKGKDTLKVETVEKFNGINGPGQYIRLANGDLPPIVYEPYITTINDYKSEVITQLTAIAQRGYMPQSFFRTWDEIAKNVREIDEIWRQRKPSKAMKADLKTLITPDMTPTDKMEAIHKFIAKRMEWSGKYKVGSDSGIGKAYDKRTGNSSELNLMLTAMMREAGLAANIALISTRDNGKVILDYPLVSQFNHLICVVEIDQRAYALDIIDGYRSPYLLPERDLQRNAFVIKDKGNGWLYTTPLQNTTQRTNIKIDLEDASVTNVVIEFSVQGMYAETAYRELKNGTEEEFIKNRLIDPTRLQLDSTHITLPEIRTKPIKVWVSGTVDLTEFAAGDFIYFNPYSLVKTRKNPFTKEKRDIPVEFPYTFKEQMVASINLSSQYETDELPKNRSVTLQGKGKTYTRLMTQGDSNTIMLMSDFQLGDITYPIENYEQVKTLFEEYAQSVEKPIVIKRVQQ